MARFQHIAILNASTFGNFTSVDIKKFRLYSYFKGIAIASFLAPLGKRPEDNLPRLVQQCHNTYITGHFVHAIQVEQRVLSIKGKFFRKNTIIEWCKSSFTLQTCSAVCVYLTV